MPLKKPDVILWRVNTISTEMQLFMSVALGSDQGTGSQTRHLSKETAAGVCLIVNTPNFMIKPMFGLAFIGSLPHCKDSLVICMGQSTHTCLMTVDYSAQTLSTIPPHCDLSGTQSGAFTQV